MGKFVKIQYTEEQFDKIMQEYGLYNFIDDVREMSLKMLEEKTETRKNGRKQY
jgi:hypothetical protein